jgi:hypothetical protein
MKRTFYLPMLTDDLSKTLINHLTGHCRYGLVCTFDKSTNTFSVEMATFNRFVYSLTNPADQPIKLSDPISTDEYVWKEISAYVNGFVIGLETKS